MYMSPVKEICKTCPWQFCQLPRCERSLSVRRMNKEDVVCNLCSGVLLCLKKWNFALCSSMDGLGGHCAKWNKSDRKRQILYYIIYVWNLKNTTNEWIKQINKRSRLMDIESKSVGTSWERSNIRQGKKEILYIHTYIYTHTYISVYTYIYVCVYIYICRARILSFHHCNSRI